MQITIRPVRSALMLVLTLAGLSACGNGADTGDTAEAGGRPSAAAAGDPQDCLTAAEVSNLAGLEVRALRDGTQTYGNTEVCGYQGTDERLGAFVTTIVGPAEQSEERFAEMRESVRLFRGTSAELEAIEVGEHGYAYGGGMKSEAAAVSQGRLYHAEIVSSTSADMGDRKAGMIEIVTKLMSR